MNIADLANKSKEGYSRKSPYLSTLLEVSVLNQPGSTKENLHVVLDLKGSNIEYEVGSSFGIFPENDQALVDEIVTLLNIDKNHMVYDKRAQGSLTLAAFLAKKANLQKITSAHLNLIAKHAPNARLQTVLSSKEALLKYVGESDVLSFLKDFWESSIDIQELCDVCGPLLPRYYSIASSRKVTPDCVELMVASFSYEHAGRKQKSITASYLQDRCTTGTSQVPIFLMENRQFVLPADRSTPIILIGPGTGFAALRGFLQERYAQNPQAAGNWLFTGDRNRATDFHYESELLAWEASGFLRLNLAFSRDEVNKRYVQDEMKDHAQELWHWIHQQKAHIYICGDAKRMAKDVMQTLHDTAMQEGNMSEEDAKAYIRQCKKERRLALDVY